MIYVYTQPACQPCRATKKKLTELGLEFTEIDLIAHGVPEFATDAGYTAAPLVRVEREDGTAAHWQGYRPDLIGLLNVPVRYVTSISEESS